MDKLKGHQLAKFQRAKPEAQGGATLFIVLVFLLLITILVVVGRENAILETRTVANAAFQEQALADAEYGVLMAEKALQDEIEDGNPLTLATADDEYYNYDEVDPTGTDWGNIVAQSVSTDNGTIQYVIQYGGTVAGSASGGSVKITPTGIAKTGNSYAYIITVRAEAAGAVRLVQTIYLASATL
jgi:Tfp pilus assembly protein PilX